MNAVFNETVTIVELDEGLDGETFFLYIFLAACVILALVGVQQFLSSLSVSWFITLLKANKHCFVTFNSERRADPQDRNLK